MINYGRIQALFMLRGPQEFQAYSTKPASERGTEFRSSSTSDVSFLEDGSSNGSRGNGRQL